MLQEAFVLDTSRTPFFGREQERSLLAAELERGPGLITLSGPSGIGKTRLAEQVLGQVAPSFEEEGGVWICPLSSMRDPREVELAVARMLGIPGTMGGDLARAIANRGKVLLLLDGLDAVAEALGETLVRWLDASGELRIVATSITPVGQDGEVRFSLGPLDPPDAVALYLERARRAWPERRFTAEEEGVIEALVGRLDRIPLAIELAAARVQVLPPVAMIARLEARFEVLRSDAISKNPRSLLEALTSTWELLSAEEQALIRAVSVLEGGFTAEAARAVSGRGQELGQIVDLLVRLRSKALLSIEEAETPRFELLECVQQYGALELREAGEEEAARLRHAEYFVEEGERRVAQLQRRPGKEAIAWLQAERENLLAVVATMGEAKPPLAARAGLILSSLRAVDGYSPASVELLRTTLEAARRSGDPGLQAVALVRHGGAVVAQGRIEAAQGYFAEAQELAAAAGHVEAQAEALVRAAMLCWQIGDREGAAARYERAGALARREGLRFYEAMVLMGEGDAAREELLHDEAARLIAESLAIIRAEGMVRYEGTALSRLGVAQAHQGRFREARRSLEEALQRSREWGSRWHLANILCDLGGMELSAGNLDEAERWSLESLTHLREIGNRYGEAVSLTNLGIGALERGKLKVAESRLLESVGILEELGSRRTQAEALCYLSIVEARSGRLEQARETFRDAKAALAEIHHARSAELLELIEGVHEAVQARHLLEVERDRAEELGARARRRLEVGRAVPMGRSAGVVELLRLLEQALQALEPEAGAPAEAVPTESLRLGPGAVWFEVEGKGRVDLHRRNTLRGLLAALADARRRSPGTGLSPQTLFQAGWPGVTIRPESVRNRVYIGIWSLRNMGLANILLSQPDGYLLDPAVPLEQEAR